MMTAVLLVLVAAQPGADNLYRSAKVGDWIEWKGGDAVMRQTVARSAGRVEVSPVAAGPLTSPTSSSVIALGWVVSGTRRSTDPVLRFAM